MLFKKYKKNDSISKITVSLVLISLLIFSVLSGCSQNQNSNTDTEQTIKEENIDYMKISAQEAKTMMDEQTDYIILDVRTQEEYDSGHIPNATLMPDFEIGERAESELPNKDTLILVYCRSGRRSKNAAAELASIGYTNVYEFGGIIDWPYETVK